VTEVFDLTAKLSDITDVVDPILGELSKDPNAHFCLWLNGDLGAGKTTLTGVILHRLGLDPRIPVTSPTYTYLNDYKINDHSYAHLDLYRAQGDFSPEEIGLTDTNQYRGYFVEWPNQIPNNPFLEPTHVLDISVLEQGDSRRYQMRRIND
jgi:tRNA threonylcarbamoyl adenosine modification protein YjeE